MAVIVGALAKNVNCTPLLVTPLRVTVTGPLPAFGGIWMVMLASLHAPVLLGAAPLIWTVLLPWLEPKPEPSIWIVPLGPALGGFSPLITGLITVSVTVALLANPLTPTMTGPDVALLGTVATICVLLQLLIEVTARLLMFSELVPCVAPKLLPATVICAPNPPLVGETDETTLAGTVKLNALLEMPFTMT